MSARVLVVDDILPNVKLLEAKLSSEYYDVLTATSGEEALQKIEQDAPDMILLDVMMPGMDGFEVCKRVKQNPAFAHIPVVMVTALTDNVDKIKGLEAGADDFLSKPVNDTALMARVRSLIRLKMTVDEWRARETTASQLGVSDSEATVTNEPVENAGVLVVEDQQFEADVIAETLHIDDDNVIPVDSGMKAMEYASQHDFELLIVSLNLKNEDGLRLCSHLRSNERTRATPILMVASEEDMPRVAQGLDIGAHDYIMRPLERNELLARARTQIRRKRFQERLRANYEVNLSMALTDSLTGLYNRRYLEVHFEKMLAKHREAQKTLCVVMMDIDHFKSVNDTHGHNVGDEILKVFARRLSENLRSFDLVARQGGEEFVAILPDTNLDLAKIITERLRASFADKPFVCSTAEGCLRITASLGAALINFDDPDTTVLTSLERADHALYEAKEGGRNRVHFEGIGNITPEEGQVKAAPATAQGDGAEVAGHAENASAESTAGEPQPAAQPETEAEASPSQTGTPETSSLGSTQVSAPASPDYPVAPPTAPMGAFVATEATPQPDNIAHSTPSINPQAAPSVEPEPEKPVEDLTSVQHNVPPRPATPGPEEAITSAPVPSAPPMPPRAPDRNHDDNEEQSGTHIPHQSSSSDGS